jgi:UDP-N-acetylglucosamine acyltransferase
VILGGLTAVHQFCRLGKHAITGGCSKIVQDVAPFTIADGNPARTRGVNQIGMQRHGYSEDQVKAVRAAFKAIFRSKLNIGQALDELRANSPTAEVQLLIDFVAGSQRGIVTASRDEE